ncbi:MAG: tryptophan synthase subunit alpha [Planctomycetaceae bacterium]
MSPIQTSISDVFSQLYAKNSMAFMPFITAGDPDLDFTRDLILELARQQVDLIEVGFPYSDPIADGPVIQASYTRALSKKLHVDQILQTLATIPWKQGEHRPPLVGMVSYAIVFRMGTAEFCRRAKQSGLAGLIVPDLPADEAEETTKIAQGAGLDLIQLIAPTTTPARTERILSSATGFLYCISVAGTTGVRTTLPEQLSTQLRWLKSQTKLPLAVGFGISRPEQVAERRGVADGVRVGSALVREVAAITETGATREQVLARIGELARGMHVAVRAGR